MADFGLLSRLAALHEKAFAQTLQEELDKQIQHFARLAEPTWHEGDARAVLRRLKDKWEEDLIAAKGDKPLKMAVHGYKVTGVLLGQKAMIECLAKEQDYGVNADVDIWGADELVAKHLRPDMAKWIAETSKLETTTTAEKFYLLFKEAQGNFNANDSWTPVQFAKKMIDEGLASNMNRAMLMARTTTIWAYNEGAQLNYAEYGIETKEWQTGIGEAVCPLCRPMNGKRAPVKGHYFKKGETFNGDEGASTKFNFDVFHPPLHPRCRCAIIPVLIDVDNEPEPAPPEDTPTPAPETNVKPLPLPVTAFPVIAPPPVTPPTPVIPVNPVEAWAESEHLEELFNLSPLTLKNGEIDAVKQYLIYSHSDFERWLRGTYIADEKEKKRFELKAQKLDSAARNGRTKKEMTVFMQVHGRDFISHFGIDPELHEDYMPGKIIHEPSFTVATGVKPAYHSMTKISVKLPKGMPCMPVGAYSDFEDNIMDMGKDKILLPKGVSFKIKSYTKLTTGVEEVELEAILPPKPEKKPKKPKEPVPTPVPVAKPTGIKDIIQPTRDQTRDEAAWKWMFPKGTTNYGGIGNDEAIRRKIAIAKELAKRTGLSEEDCSKLIGNWAESSNDNNYTSLMMQKAAARNFDLTLSEWQQKKMDNCFEKRNREMRDGYNTVADYRHVLETLVKEDGHWVAKMKPGVPFKTVEEAEDAFLKAMYAHTQESLKSSGIKELRAFRGVAVSDSHEMMGHLKKKIHDVTLAGNNAMESWSLQYKTAETFSHGSTAEGRNGLVLHAKVPRERILGSSLTGYGCSNEHEIVVLGPNAKVLGKDKVYVNEPDR